MDGAVRIGICSWTDKTLLKSGFYPRSASNPAQRLSYYASCFDIVEIDSTYYALADTLSAYRWVGGTPRDFLFGVKAFALFTFQKARFSSLPKWLRGELPARAPEDPVDRGELTHQQRMKLFEEFLLPVEIIRSSGRLAYLLFQFPPRWGFAPENLGYLKSVRGVCGPIPLAVELRNRSWYEESNFKRLLSVLTDQNIAYTAVDEPALTWTAPPVWPTTAEWGTLARFHGRNAAGWSNARATVRQRFDYEYSPQELDEWREKALAFIGSDKPPAKLFLMFNNCVGDKAVRGAKLFSDMIGVPLKGSVVLERTLGFDGE